MQPLANQQSLFLEHLQVPSSPDTLSLLEARQLESQQAQLSLQHSSGDLPSNVNKSLLNLGQAAQKLNHRQYSTVRHLLDRLDAQIEQCADFSAGETRQVAFVWLASQWNSLLTTSPRIADFIKESSLLLQCDTWNAEDISDTITQVLRYCCPHLRNVAADCVWTVHEPLNITYAGQTINIKPMGLEYFIKSNEHTTKLLPGESAIITNVLEQSFSTRIGNTVTPEIVHLPRHMVICDQEVEPFRLVLEVGIDTQALTVYDAGIKRKLRLHQGQQKVTYDPGNFEE